MSPTEIIATKLLGWIVLNEYGDYEKDATCATVNRNGELVEDWFPASAKPHEIHDWPDLTDWNDIHLIQAAIYHKGLIDHYALVLHGMGVPHPKFFFATPEQRVAAALKVIEEAGL
jgi:hypothetical protein